jgi:glutamine synthetase
MGEMVVVDTTVGAAPAAAPVVATKDNIARLLADDHKVKVAGVDCEGMLRGKVMDKDKFLSSLDDGFGFSSVLFGWDLHDVLYDEVPGQDTPIQKGYGDFNAIPDLKTMRRLPWEDNIALFLCRFEVNHKPVFADGRSILKSMCEEIGKEGLKGVAGGETD